MRSIFMVSLKREIHCGPCNYSIATFTCMIEDHNDICMRSIYIIWLKREMDCCFIKQLSSLSTWKDYEPLKHLHDIYLYVIVMKNVKRLKGLHNSQIFHSVICRCSMMLFKIWATDYYCICVHGTRMQLGCCVQGLLFKVDFLFLCV